MKASSRSVSASTIETVLRRFFFPVLADTRTSHAWTGRRAGTADLYPLMGVHDGIHYALGYCFSGMAMGPHLAREEAATIVGQTDQSRTSFEAERFEPLPLPAREPWIGPLLAGYWAWADRPRGLERAI